MEGVACSAKHFAGDGTTLNGWDEGNNRIYNFTSWKAQNLPGYLGAID